ncbi:hypothetical protein [Nocardia sp. NPDC050710]|uniref:hypothetical protein n=1 Tax=Nocardia sp. NPDC050710 TaxID=3157220 RepID=UPI0033E28C07
MDQLDVMVAEGVQRALAETGLGIKDLVKGTSIPPSVLCHQLAAETSFTLSDLVRVASALGRRTVDLLPDVGRIP